MSNGFNYLYGAHRENEDPYADDYRALPVKLQRTREALQLCFRPIFQELDLTDQQWRVLRVLSVVDEIDTAALAQRAVLLSPSLSRILKDLNNRELVQRRICSDDGRRTQHSITNKGRHMVAALAPELDPVFDTLKSAMTNAEMRQLNSLLDKVLTILSS